MYTYHSQTHYLRTVWTYEVTYFYINNLSIFSVAASVVTNPKNAYVTASTLHSF